MKYNKHLAEYTIKNKIRHFFPNLSIKAIFLNPKNSKTQNNSSNMEWWVWIVWRFLFSVRYLISYSVHHKKYETLYTNTPIHIYINKVNNRLVSKTKDGYKLELQTSESMKLFGSTKKLIDKTKNGESVTSECNVTQTHNHLVHKKNTQPCSQGVQTIGLCCMHLSVRCIWLCSFTK